MPKPTKLDMRIQLRAMIAEKRKNYKDDDSTIFETALDIACLNRCLAMVDATMPEQMDDAESLQES